jgi:hypothetical protein
MGQGSVSQGALNANGGASLNASVGH